MVNNTWAQSRVLSLDKEYNIWYDSDLSNINDTFQSCIYPRIISNVTNFQEVNNTFLWKSNSKLANALTHNYAENLFSKYVSLHAIINWEESIASDKAIPFNRSLGLGAILNISKNWSVEFSLCRVRQKPDLFERSLIDSTMYLLEKGRVEDKKKLFYDYTSWRGLVNYQVGSHFHFQVGKSSNFWGDGYRSLLLSDNVAAYPFAKITATAGKISYIVLYQFLRDVDTDMSFFPEEKKYATSHFLSWNIAKRFNINLFESVVWRDKMDNGGKRGYDFNYINPIIFFRPVEYSMGSSDNMLVGIGFRARFFKNIHLYGQMILDEFKLDEIREKSGWWGNKYGYQLGLKSYHFLGIKNLFVRLEYNMVRPFTYSHRSSVKNYGHMCRSMAHPFGANFKEYLGVINYRVKQWQVQFKAVKTDFGTDQDSLNVGHNIYRPYSDYKKEYGNTVLQGNLNRLFNLELKVSYIINPIWNFRIQLGYRHCHWNQTTINFKQDYVFVGFKTIW